MRIPALSSAFSARRFGYRRTSLWVGLPCALLGTCLLAAFAAMSACTTSGTVATSYGTLPDGAPAGPPEGGTAPRVACLFDELDTFTCPGITLSPPTWNAKCVDQDDCATRVSGTTTSAGCQEAKAYANVQQIPGSCAAWQADGGILPVADSGPPPVCAAGDVTGFTPTWRPPRPKTTSCDATQIDGYIQCLFDAQTTPNPASCAEWTGALSTTDQACLTCLTSNATDTTYGPLVFLPTELLINVAGCIALAEGKTDGSGCGGALQADEECQRAACLPSCPTSSAQQVSLEQSCEAQANYLPAGDAGGGGACAAYVQPAECAGAIEALDAGTAAERQCFGGADGGAHGQLTAVALAFCGP